MPEPAPGETHAGCTLERLLGRGGMGTVFLARRPDGQQVVVKFLAPELAESPALLERFRREWGALRKIHPHPNVVRVLDVRAEDPHPSLTLEFAPGTPLDRMLRERGRLPPLAAARIGRDIARGLAAVHGHGLIHRDVKPANAIVSDQGVTKLVDFGLAKDLFLSALTKPGELLGTAHYMAPEQWEGEAVDARTDVFALGATIYHLACGAPPFAGSEPEDIADACLDGDMGRPRELVPDLSPELELVILRALMIQPRHRYPRMTDLADDLQRVLQRQPARVPCLVGPQGLRHPLIPEEWTTIGTAPACQLRLEHPSVAPKHAQVRREDQGFIVCDFTSGNTRVEGAPVVANQTRPLRDGDEVSFGEVTLRFSDPLATAADASGPAFLRDIERRVAPAPVVETLAAAADPRAFLTLLEDLTPDPLAEGIADRALAALGPEAVQAARAGRRRAWEGRRADLLATLPAMTRMEIEGDPAQWLGWWHQVRTTAPAQVAPPEPSCDLRLRVVAGPAAPAVLPLADRGVVLVGRDPRCQLRVDLATAPRLHATLLRLHRRWAVVDEGGPQGTQLGDRPVRWAFLDPGAALTLGPVQLVLEADPPDRERLGPQLVVDPASFRALRDAAHPATCAGLVGILADAARPAGLQPALDELEADADLSARVHAHVQVEAAAARAALTALLGQDAGADAAGWRRLLEARRGLPTQVLPRGWLPGTRP